MKYAILILFLLLWGIKLVTIAYDPPQQRVQVVRNFDGLYWPEDVE
jgi:hypothetical protein